MVFLPSLSECNIGTSSALMIVLVMPFPSGSMTILVPAYGACSFSSPFGMNIPEPSVFDCVVEPGTSTLLPSWIASCIEEVRFLCRVEGWHCSFAGCFHWLCSLSCSYTY
jgi:hypothetical protein